MNARDLLRAAIEANRLTVAAAAQRMRVPISTLSSALTGRRTITPDLALRAEWSLDGFNARKALHLQLEEQIEAQQNTTNYWIVLERLTL